MGLAEACRSDVARFASTKAAQERQRELQAKWVMSNKPGGHVPLAEEDEHALFYVLKHAAPVMTEQGSGSMIATASVCGLEAGIGAHIYTVAKAGVISMMRSMALEMAEHGVRANAICPGYIATSLMAGRTRSQVDDAETDSRLDHARDVMGHAQPMHRVGEPDDIANMALFLASDESSWVTGTAQVVDGGLIVGKPWRRQPAVMTESRPITMYKV